MKKAWCLANLSFFSAEEPDHFTYNKTAHDGRRYVVVLNFAGFKKVWKPEQSAEMLLSTVEDKKEVICCHHIRVEFTRLTPDGLHSEDG